eukprot:SAG11_NODE_4311_length_1953_cov_1.192017_3_plen_284_part_00
MVTVRLAHQVMENSQRELRDVYLFRKPKPPRGKGKGEGSSQKPAGSPKNPADVIPRSVRHWRERPWLSARELRMRARWVCRCALAFFVPLAAHCAKRKSAKSETFSSGERATARIRDDMREAKELKYKHRMHIDARLGPKATHTILTRAVVSNPRELAHVRRVKLPPVKPAVLKPRIDVFGAGDKVKLVVGSEQLAYGMPQQLVRRCPRSTCPSTRAHLSPPRQLSFCSKMRANLGCLLDMQGSARGGCRRAGSHRRAALERRLPGGLHWTAPLGEAGRTRDG